MSELRQNPITKEWVIMATDRAKRPNEFAQSRSKHERKLHDEHCPFCPGNEHMTPPEEMRIPATEGEGWKLRIVPNKFPALSPQSFPEWTIHRTLRSVRGSGSHDVIIESPDHSHCGALLPLENLITVLRTYRSWFKNLSENPQIAHVTIFKNHGAGAGTSLEHPHSQIIASPVVSSPLRARFYEAMRHWDEYGECVFCRTLHDELDDDRRIVFSGHEFVAFEPFAARSPFLTQIFPRRHMASFGDVRDKELEELAGVLHSTLWKMYSGLNDPDFNYTIMTAPHHESGARHYHWYLEIVPRLSEVAGFELGSGTFINTVLPEEATDFLRKVKSAETYSAGEITDAVSV